MASPEGVQSHFVWTADGGAVAIVPRLDLPPIAKDPRAARLTRSVEKTGTTRTGVSRK